jgi:protein ImuB
MLAVWYPDWPVVAAGAPAHVPAVVVAANEVLAASAVARSYGIRPGLRRREAQSRCPGVAVLPADPDRDAVAFEAVASAVDAVLPGVEVTRPGVCVAASRGAARYFGGDEAVVGQIRRSLAAVHAAGSTALAAAAFGVGVADGPFAAALAARENAVVPPGQTAAFLAPRPVGLLGRPGLADLLGRLGLTTMGRFAALPAEEVLARFGPDGARDHRLARGLDHRPLLLRKPAADLGVAVELDPPAADAAQVAFAARRLAGRMHDRLAQAGFACSRILVEAETAHGERTSRFWRNDGALSAAAVADRVRWQLDGWLAGSAGSAAPSAGVVSIRLVPDQLVPAEGRQLGLWGDPGAVAGRVARGLSRVQGLLGPSAVVTATLCGGRDPARRVRLTPWGEAAHLGPGPSAGREPEPPWPGRLPAPAPATVPAEPRPAAVVDSSGAPVRVSGRCEVSAPPAALSVAGGSAVRVTGWSGPWPADERWWDASARRRARFQMTTDDGTARLLAVEAGRWWVEAIYD